MWPDRDNQDPSYWDKLLKKLHLTMDRGRNERVVTYGHDFTRRPNSQKGIPCGGGWRKRRHRDLGELASVEPEE